MSKNKVAAVDFDGVIHGYSDGWHRGVIYDAPVKGAAEGLKELKQMGYRIIIFSTRTNKMYRKNGEPEQLPQMEEYMKKHGLIYDELWSGPGKPMAQVYIDDRAVPFRGNWRQTVDDVANFKVWNRPDAKSSSETWTPD